MQIKNKWYVKVTIIVATILVVASIILQCINENPYDFHYNGDERKLSFILAKKGDIKVDIYWNNNLIASPTVEYDEENERYYVDVFPNLQIGGENTNPYLLDMCYEYSKEKKLPLQYVVTHKYYLEDVDLEEEKKTIFNINVKKILDDNVTTRVARLENIEFPKLNLEGTGYCYLNYRSHPDYYKQVKSLLYERGLRNIPESLIHDTSFYWGMLQNLGFQIIEIANPPLFEEELATNLLMNVSDKWEKIYLLKTSLSPLDNMIDANWDFESMKEINKYISNEYADNFKNAVFNKSGNIMVPIKLIGNHNYNFVQLLYLVTIDNNDNYQAIPIAYALRKDDIEKAENEKEYGGSIFNNSSYLKEEGIDKNIINPYRINKKPIGDYYVHYSGPLKVRDLKKQSICRLNDYYDNATISKPYVIIDQSKQSKWNNYLIANSFCLSVPNTVELREKDDIYTQAIENNDWYGQKIDLNNIVFQQKGLSNVENEAFKTYCRIMIAFKQYTKDSFPISTDKTTLDEKTISGFQEQAIKSAGNFKILDKPIVKWVKVNNIYAIEVKYVRTGVEGHRTCVSTYNFYNNDKFAQITLSYREADKDKWEKDFENVVKTFKWSSDDKLLEKLGTTTDIDRKLEILAEDTNKNLPQKIDDITVLKKVEIHANREVRYCYTILDDNFKVSSTEIENYRKEIILKVKQENNLNRFKELDVIMAYGYYKENGDCIMLIKIYPKDYK